MGWWFGDTMGQGNKCSFTLKALQMPNPTQWYTLSSILALFYCSTRCKLESPKFCMTWFRIWIYPLSNGHCFLSNTMFFPRLNVNWVLNIYTSTKNSGLYTLAWSNTGSSYVLTFRALWKTWFSASLGPALTYQRNEGRTEAPLLLMPLLVTLG